MRELFSLKSFQVLVVLSVMGLIGWFVPFAPLKIILVFTSIIFLAFTLKTFTGKMAGFIVLSLLLFFIPASIGYYGSTHSFSWFNFEPFIKGFLNQVPSNKITTVFPDTLVQSESVIQINLTNVEVQFTDSDRIMVPGELSVRSAPSGLIIEGGSHLKKYILEIGKADLKDLQIRATTVSLTGSANLRNLRLNSTSINISGTIEAQEMFADGTGINLNGNFSGKDLILNGTGVSLSGSYEFQDILIDCTGISLHMDLSNCNHLSIDTTGINGTINYSGDTDLYVQVDGTGGKLKLVNKSNADVFIDSSGVKVARE